MKIPFLPFFRRAAGALLVASVAANLVLALAAVRLGVRSRSLESSRVELRRSLDEALARQRETSAKLEEASKRAAELEAEVAKLRQDSQTVDQRIAAAEQAAAEANDEKTYLEDILIYQNRELDALRKNVGADVQELAKKLLDREEEARRLQLENARLRQSAPAATDAQAVDLGTVRVEETPASAAPPRAPRKEGRVLAVNDDHGFVVVNLGRVDGIQNEMPLFLSKDDEVVATLSVVETRDVMSACNVKSLKNGVRIEVNDPVNLRKG